MPIDCLFFKHFVTTSPKISNSSHLINYVNMSIIYHLPPNTNRRKTKYIFLNSTPGSPILLKPPSNSRWQMGLDTGGESLAIGRIGFCFIHKKYCSLSSQPNHISLVKLLFLILGFQIPIASNRLKIRTKGPNHGLLDLS